MSRLRLTPAARAAVALGGLLGALGRWALGELFPEGGGFPWTTFGINVSGSFLLALLPAVGAVRHHLWLVLLLGPGMIGGFTTLSAYADQTRSLLAAQRPGLAAAYVLGTLLACLLAVAVADRLSSPQDRCEFDDEEGNE